jgi:hypothetical protein
MGYVAPRQPPLRTRTIVVDSRKRDLASSPAPDSYSVKLSEELRAVESLELVYALYPSSGADSYAHLFVAEAEDRGSIVALDATEVSGALAQLPLIAPMNEYTPARHYRAAAVFRVPLARLSKLTVRFADAFGRPYPFLDHLLRFEAVCGERHRDGESDLVQRLAAAPAPVPAPRPSPVASPSFSASLAAPAHGQFPATAHGQFPATAHAHDSKKKRDAGVRALHNLSKSLSALAVGDSGSAGRRR